MFKWKDYEENSILFVEGINTGIAKLKHKDFTLIDSATGNKVKLKAYSIDDAKINSEEYLAEYWKQINEETTKLLSYINR